MSGSSSSIRNVSNFPIGPEFDPSFPALDLPIYLQFEDVDYDDKAEPYLPRYKWYVIEKKTMMDEEEEHRWIHKSEDDQVRHLCLPKLNFDVVGSDVAFYVSDSRIFFIGGHTRRGESSRESNGILWIDSRDNNPSWERCTNWGRFSASLVGTALFRGIPGWGPADWICVLLREGISLYFDRNYFDSGDFIVADYPEVVEVQFPFGMPLTIPVAHKRFPDPPKFQYPRSTSNRSVVVEEFVICFLKWSPVKNTGDYCPALYVYDIRVGEWLSQPVQGLPNNGIVLPRLLEDITSEWTMNDGFLMHVGNNTPKLALVWEIAAQDVNEENEVHWAKFTLNTKHLKAENLSYGAFNAGSAILVNSTAG